MHFTFFLLVALSACATSSGFDLTYSFMGENDHNNYFTITYEQLWDPSMHGAQAPLLPNSDEAYDTGFIDDVLAAQVRTPSTIAGSPHSVSTDQTQLMEEEAEDVGRMFIHFFEWTPSPAMPMVVEDELSPVDQPFLAIAPVASGAAAESYQQPTAAPITNQQLLQQRSSRMIAKLMQARRDDQGFEDRELNIPCPSPDCSIYIKAESKALAHCCRHIAGGDAELERLLTDAAVTAAITGDELDSGLVVYACHQCNRYFHTHESFNDHVRSLHADGVVCTVSDCNHFADASMQTTTKFFCSALSQHILGEHKSSRKAYAMYSVLSGGGYMTSGHLVRHHRSILERFQQR